MRKKYSASPVSKKRFKKSLPFIETHEETKENDLLDKESSSSELLADSSEPGVAEPQNEDDERSEERKKYGLFINEETLEQRFRRRKHFDSDDSEEDYQETLSSEAIRERERIAEAHRQRILRNEKRKTSSESHSSNLSLKHNSTELKFNSDSTGSSSNNPASPIFKVRTTDNNVVSLDKFELANQSTGSKDDKSVSYAFARPKTSNEPSISLKNSSIKIEFDPALASPDSPNLTNWVDDFEPVRKKFSRKALRKYLHSQENCSYRVNREFLFVDDENDTHALKRKAKKSKFLASDDEDSGKKKEKQSNENKENEKSNIKEIEINDDDISVSQMSYRSFSTDNSTKSRSKYLQFSSDEDD